MAKPCIFCGGNAEREIFVKPNIHSWVLKPYEPYPMCDECEIAMNQDTLADRICLKWKNIEESRGKVKRKIPNLKKSFPDNPTPLSEPNKPTVELKGEIKNA